MLKFSIGSAILAGALIMALASASESEAAIITGGTDIALNNGYQCVEVAGGFTTPGTTVQSWDCWGGLNQQWQFYQGQILGIGSEIAGQGSTHLNCMDVKGTSVGSGVVLNACNGASTQLWAVGGGRITSVASHLCLDLGAGYSTSGIQLTLNTCSNSLSEKFAIR